MTIEFLPSDEPDDRSWRGPAERPPAPHQWHRGWWLVAAVLAAAAIAWALTRPEAVPQPAAAPSVLPSSHVVAACRGVPDCSVRSDVPRSIAVLVRSYLPPGVRLRVRTVVAVDTLSHEDLLVERDVDAAVNSVTVLIRLQRAGTAVRNIVPDPPGIDSVLLHQVNSGFVVRLQYMAPRTVPLMIGRLRSLIRDPRLASV